MKARTTLRAWGAIFSALLILGGCPPEDNPNPNPNPKPKPKPKPKPSITPDCDDPEEKDGYLKHACRYERLHVEGAMPVDVYTPTEPVKGAPVVMFVHGGGWIEGSRHPAEHFLGPWAQAGIIGLSITYELRPPVPLIGESDAIDSPEEMRFQRDAAAAFAWIRRHAETFGGDPEHIVLMGHSAGGHIVTLLTAQRSWITEALLASGQLDPADADSFRVSDVVRGLVNLSGPLDLDLSRRNFGDVFNFLIAGVWSPAMRVEGSPLTWLEIEQDGPPMLHTVGGGTNLAADPSGIIGGQVDYVTRARELGISATLVQPIFQSVHNGFQFPFQDFNGALCLSHLTHNHTIELLHLSAVKLELGQAYAESRGDTCNAQSLAGLFVTHPHYRTLVENFILDPEAPIDWHTPDFSDLSIPDVDPSPLRLNAGGGALPDAAGDAWSALPRSVNVTGFRSVNNTSFDLSGVTDGNGNPLPEGLFHFQLIAGGSPSLEIHTPVPPGTYRVRLYFGETSGVRLMDVEVEGVLRATGVPSRTGALGVAEVFELPEPVTVDDTFDLVLLRSGETGPTPSIAAIELVP